MGWSPGEIPAESEQRVVTVDNTIPNYNERHKYLSQFCRGWVSQP